MEIIITSISRDVNEVRSNADGGVIYVTTTNVYTIHFKIKVKDAVMDSSMEITSDEDMSFSDAEKFIYEQLDIGR